MLSRYFSLSAGKNSKKKWNKEISLTVNDKHNPDGYTLKVPKRCLIEHSKYFRDKQNELKKTKKIHMDEVTITALQKIVEYMQHSTIVFFHTTEVLETLKASHKYQMEDLVDICSNHLLTVLESGNVCDVYSTASNLHLSHLEYPCLKLIDECADEVLMSRGFLTLEKATVREIIKRNSLNISSETIVFRAVMGWSLNDSLRNGIDASDPEKFIPSIKSLFSKVRFEAMSVDEMADPDISKYHKLLTSSEPWNRVRSVSDLSQSSSGSNEIPPDKMARFYVDRYKHNLDAYEANLHKIKLDEVFRLKVDVLKGCVFFTGLKLGFHSFAVTKKDACLYVVLTATNVSTSEQKTTRGAFLSMTDEASLVFTSPLKATELEGVEFSLSVKRAENVCPLAVNRGIQIAMPESKAVALKILPVAASETDEIMRCVFKELEYFF